MRIAADGDAGLQGGVGVFATSEETQGLAYWTEDRGWAPYSDTELIKPAQRGLKKLETTREYVVFKGRNEGLCKLSNGQSFNVYAWHASLTAIQVTQVITFLKRFDITGWQAENYWNSLLFYQANIHKKGGLVFTHHCGKPE